MKRAHLIVNFVLFASLLAACTGTVSNPPTPDVNVIVEQTMRAFTAEAGPDVTPDAPTSTSDRLPRPLYFLNTDVAAHLQIFRLAMDGETLTQLTFEPADVDAYDVNQLDGRVVYVSNNQMLLINADGSGRQVLLDGGPVDENNPFLTRINNAVWSPDGRTIAYGHGGLNLYSNATGASNRVIENKFRDVGNGLIIPEELYWPDTFSPDGTTLLITLGYYEGGSFAIYYPSSNSLVRLKYNEGERGVCCGAQWAPDSAALFAGIPTIGMFSSGLWRIDAASGQVTTLIPGEPDNGTLNFADAPQIGPDGQLYFFFANTPATDEFFASDVPLQLVRSAPDGVTGRTVLLPDTFDRINEALWSPDVSFVIVALGTDDQMWQGGQAEIVYVDGRSRVVLVPFAQEMKWGP